MSFHISISRTELLSGLSALIGIVERRQTLAVLSNILLRAEGDRLTLAATDLEIELRARAFLLAPGDGETTVPARKLFDICRSLPEGSDLTLAENDPGRLVAKSGKARFTLATLPAKEFPLFEAETGAVAEVHVPAAALASAIARCRFAMAVQDVRYYLNGMLVEISGPSLNAVSTDGHRLAFATTTLAQPVETARSLIVPRKTVLELERLLPSGDDAVVLKFSGNQLAVELDAVSLVSKLIDGKFPDYNRVIPRETPFQAVVERQPFASALSRTAILSNDKVRGARLFFAPGQVTVQTNNVEQEEAEEILDIDYQGENLEIGFNIGYLLDALNALNTERVRLSLRGPDASVLVEAATDGPVENRYVVMPMKL